MKNTFYNGIIQPYLYSCNSIITDVNKEFIEYTGFTMDELLGKSLIEMGDMLKINSQMKLDNINIKSSVYIFTKSLSAREVNISVIYDKEKNEKKYTFIEKEKSRLDDKMMFVKQTFNDNVFGVAVYSVPDLILLKVNQKYLDFMDSPFNNEENSIGRPITEFVTGFVGSEAEAIWKNFLETQKTSHIKELQFNEFERGITFWDFTLIPIFENGRMKYIYETASEVTEGVLKNQSIEGQKKIIEQQREQLEKQNIELEGKNIQLENQNAQLISIIENLSEGIIIADNKGKIIMSNSEARRLIYQSDKVNKLGEVLKTTKYMDMEGKEILYENMPGIRALRGEKVKDVKILVINPDKEFFMDVSSIPIYNTHGELTIVVSCFHDITETFKKSRKIKEQKKQLEAIIQNISNGISIFDNKGQYILSNQSAKDIYLSSYEYIDKIGDAYKQSEFYDIDGEQLDLENIPESRVMRGEKFKNMRIALKFSHKTIYLDVSGIPIYDKKGDFKVGVLCSRDMTGYIKYEEDIRNQYELLKRIIDTVELPVIRLSCPDLKIVDINKKAFSIIKLIKPNIKSISQINDNNMEYLAEIFKIEDYCQYISEVLKEKKTKYLNKKKYLLNGEDTYWNVIFEPIPNANGEIQEILILIVDVTTEIKSTIVMEKTLKAQGEFLANISHELKTPLNVIYSTVQLFSMYCNRGSLDQNKNSIIKYIESMKQNSYRLSKLINNIVDSSKIEAGFFELNLSNNNISEVVETIMTSVINFTDSKGLNIIFDTDTEEKIIACDPEKIERIVLNLISNAIKFSNVGDEIFVEVKDKNEFVEISVKDNGMGIEEKYLDMIFDRFKQVDKSLARNAEGTGIGLSLVKSIVELHDGSIYVESEFGKGSKFTFVLPAKRIMQENMLLSSNIRNINERIEVEFSDVNS